MPYVGSDRDQGAGIFNAYVQGAQLKLANRREAANEKQRLLEMQIAAAQEERAKRAEIDARQQREVGNYFRTQEDSRAQSRFEMEAADYKKQQAEDLATGSARYGAARFGAKELLSTHPELQPDFGEVQAFLQSPEGQKLPPEAKAKYVEGATAAIGQKLQKLELDKAESHWRDEKAYGGLNGPDNAPDPILDTTYQHVMEGMNLFRTSGGKEGISPAQAEVTMRQARNEHIKRASIAESRMNAEAFLANKITTLGLQPGSPQEVLAIGVRNAVKMGVLNADQGSRALDVIARPPKPPAAASAKQDPHEKTRNDFLQHAYTAGLTLTGKPPDIERIKKDADALFGPPKPSDAELQAAMETQRNTPDTSHKPGKRTLALTPYEADAEAAGEASRAKVLAKDPKAYAQNWQANHPGASEEEFIAAMKAAGFGGK